MNKMFAIYALASLIATPAYSASWTKAKTTTTATLRVATSLPDSYKEDFYLKAAHELPAGTELRYVSANTTSKSYLYDTSSGGLAYSRYGWVRTILIDHIPGNPLSTSELREINQKPLFISQTLEKTFEFEDGGLQPPSGSYDTSRCYSSLVNRGVPSTPLVRLFNFYNSNQSDIIQKRYLAMSDYSQSSSRERFYMIDLADCSVDTEKVAHGSGSFTHNGVFNRWGDPEHDGMLNRCSYGGNRQNMTRPGFALIKGYHYSSQNWPVISSTGAKGLKLYALGRAKSENFNLIGRGVVMHEQYYVNYNPAGRSYGCPALKPTHLKPKVARLIEGALYYSYAPQCGDY